MKNERMDRRMRLVAVCSAALFLLASPGMSRSGEMGHGAALGEKVYAGPIGAWAAEVRLVDMKAQMAKVKVSAKAMEKMTATHHVMVFFAGPGAKKPVTAVKGSVTVTGPSGKPSKAALVAMGDHAGADLTLPAPGSYRFDIEIASEGKKGTASFPLALK